MSKNHIGDCKICGGKVFTDHECFVDMDDELGADEICKELKKYTELCCDESQEVCDILTHIVGYPDYISKSLYNSIVKELDWNLRNYEANYNIVEREEKITHKTKDLVEK